MITAEDHRDASAAEYFVHPRPCLPKALEGDFKIPDSVAVAGGAPNGSRYNIAAVFHFGEQRKLVDQRSEPDGVRPEACARSAASQAERNTEDRNRFLREHG